MPYRKPQHSEFGTGPAVISAHPSGERTGRSGWNTGAWVFAGTASEILAPAAAREHGAPGQRSVAKRAVVGTLTARWLILENATPPMHIENGNRPQPLWGPGDQARSLALERVERAYLVMKRIGSPRSLHPNPTSSASVLRHHFEQRLASALCSRIAKHETSVRFQAARRVTTTAVASAQSPRSLSR